jgi:CheY-like chemotaxis protein
MAFVLMVDDDKDILELGRVVLGAAHHHVWTATSVIDALELLKTRAFDVVVTDANMRPYSGYDFLKTVRAEPAWKDIPVAMLTGRRDKKDIERAVEGGVSDYIIKPIDPALLQRKINELAARGSGRSASPQVRSASLNESAQVLVSGELIRLSEAGATLLTSIPLSVGQFVHIESATLASLGVPSPTILVESCQPITGKGRGMGYEVNGRFDRLEERFALRIRAWVHQKVETRKGAA